MLPYAMNDRWSGAAFILALGCLLFVAPPRCEAQSNLVPNHSFEEYDTCLVVNDVYYPDTGPLGWFSAGWTPDHMMSCLPYGSFNGVPLNAWSFQYPQDGECYAAVLTYREFPEGREYFMVQLVEPLVVGQQYFASFYANPCWGGYLPSPQMWMATNGIGMVFTTQPRQWELDDPIPAPLNYAHVYSQSTITDTSGWTLVSGSFVADSAYQYVMLGNPFDNASTDTVHFAAQTNLPRGGMLIDNVCVSANPGDCPMAVGMEEQMVVGFRIYPNPAQQWLMIIGVELGTPLRIHDMVGRCVWQGRALGTKMQLDVGAWARGAYMLRMEGTRKQSSLKFVLVE
jgi:hypothetical protein